MRKSATVNFRMCLATGRTWPYYLLCLLLLVACSEAPAAEESLEATEAPLTQTDSEPAATAVATVIAAAPTAEPTATETAAALPVTNTPAPTSSAASGALIEMRFASQVGVLLDGIPATLREEISEIALNQTEEEWLARAQRQIRLSRLRLNFRGFGEEGLGQLPLTPEELWQVDLDPAGPQLGEIDGHQLILQGYTFKTTILTDLVSPGTVEPELAPIGGLWLEPFVFPADPDLLTQRTGNACLNEAGFPPNSYDSQNYWHLYDFACTALSGGALGCHRTTLPNFSCQEALDNFIGSVSLEITFERLEWDPDLADEVRLGPNKPGTPPDLEVVQSDLAVNRIVYRWFPPEDCALAEQAVNASGWRRILQFNATVHNIGGSTLDIGRVSEIDVFHHIFEYSPCHDHFHYSNYGTFDLVELFLPFSSKKAFCVQSTSRFSNNESSPLDHEYSCTNQGIQAGWVDEYIAGLDVQWIDVTDLQIPEEGLAVTLGFGSNADGFICEGEPVVDASGERLWEPSGFFTDEGDEINRPVCDFVSDWDSNNYGELEVFIPATGSYVTEPCSLDAFGPLRDCGFAPLELADSDNSCEPGAAVEIDVPAGLLVEMMVLRVCESSAFVGGLACDFSSSVRSVPVSLTDSTVSFTCPAVRDGLAGSGGYSLYIAPYLETVAD